MKRYINNQGGFTIVELMVTLGVAAFVMAGVYSTSILQMKNVNITNDVGKIQQNVRIATGMVERDLRFAGYGIGNGTIYSSLVGLAGGNLAALTVYNDNPDRIDLVYLETASKLDVTQQMPQTAANIKIDPTANYAKYNEGDIIIVTDGTHSDMFGITGKQPAHMVHNSGMFNGAKLNVTQKLSWSYGPGASVYKAYYAAYYVENNNLMIDPNGPDADGNLNGQLMVPNVETMDVMVGVDLNDDDQIDSTEWLSGDHETGVDKILAAKLSLSSLSPSTDPNYQTDPEVIGDQNLLGGLNHRRRVVTRVVNLRNLARK